MNCTAPMCHVNRALFAAMCFGFLVNAQAQPTRSVTPMITETSPNSDTIGERAAWSLEQQRLKNNPAPAAAAGPIGIIPTNAQRAGSAPEFAVTGIRGFAGALEASFLINGKRASGSARYPTLVDNWKVVEITSAGAEIEKNRERKKLTFSGSSPYQEKPSSPAVTLAPGGPFGGPLPMGGLPLPPSLAGPAALGNPALR